MITVEAEQSSSHEQRYPETTGMHANVWEFRRIFEYPRKLVLSALSELRNRPAKQVPYLDFLRSVAILLVILDHADMEFVRQRGSTFLSGLPVITGGWMGVDLFFVLSGFLIGGQIWKELRKDHKVKVKDFILRRGYRIWPLYFFVFICVLLAGRATAGHWWSDLIFLTNYFNNGVVMGSWSLCTEEQFYIVTPVLVYLGARSGVSNSSYRGVLILIFLALPFIRAITWIQIAGGFFNHDPSAFSTIYYPFHTHCDGLVMGLLISNVWVMGLPSRLGLLKSWWSVGLAFLAFLGLRRIQHEIFIFTGLALFWGSALWYGLHSANRVVLRLTGVRAFYWISRLSYGMYLNHNYFSRFLVAHAGNGFGLGHIFPVIGEFTTDLSLVLVSMAISFLTFSLVEHPFLLMRSRLVQFRAVSQLRPGELAQTASQS